MLGRMDSTRHSSTGLSRRREWPAAAANALRSMIAMRLPPRCADLAFAIAVTALGAIRAQTPIDLPTAVGGDPVAALRAIGAATSREAARALAAPLRERLDGPSLLALLRFGFGHGDEGVVLGAAVLNGGRFVAVPELARAAAVVVPRTLAPASPLTLDDVHKLVSSRDVAAILTRAASIPDDVAANWVGQAHRMLRAEHVPLLDAAARAANGQLRAALVDDAALVAEYSGQHEDRAVALQAWSVAATAADRIDGLPQPLRALLDWLVRDHAAARAQFPDQDVAWTRPLRRAPAARWLRRCRPVADDAPLLLAVAHLPDFALRCAAYTAMATLTDEATKERLIAAADAGSASAASALVVRGDTARLDALLQATTANELACGLAAASPERRLRFWRELLATDGDVALGALQAFAEASAGALGPDAPAFDDAWAEGVEALALAARELSPMTLRALLAAVPGCATARLCDRLLAASPAQWLVTPTPGVTVVDELGLEVDLDPCIGDCGWRGALPLLEVTRPDGLRAALRTALTDTDATVRDAAARSLLRLNDQPSAPQLVAWVRAQNPPPWRALGAFGGAVAFAALKQAAEAATEEDDDLRVLAQALARADGMPEALADAWYPENEAASVAKLLADGAAAAWIADATGAATELDAEDLAALTGWRDPAIEAFLAPKLAAAASAWDEDTVASWRWLAAVARGDADELAALRTLLRDGSYALQSTLSGRLAAAALGREALAFWIDELGSNCCRKSDLADDAFVALFGCEPQSAEEDAEPAAARLRRRLLPLQGRLRWSMLANGWVVAGR